MLEWSEVWQGLSAAASLGVQSCWVAGDKKAYAAPIAQLLGVPAQFLTQRPH